MKRIERLNVGQSGFQKLDVDVHIYGTNDSTERKIAITACIHGDEHAGLFVIDQIRRELEALDSSGLLKGTVDLIPSANPAALFDNRRVAALDYKDLNRVGRGNKNGSYTERAGAVLFEYLKQFDFVINLHEFEMQTPVTAIYTGAGNTRVRKQTLEAISAFNPDMVWTVDIVCDQYALYLLTLDIALANAGVANFPIEMTQLAFLSQSDLTKTVTGILNVFVFLGLIDRLHYSQLSSPVTRAFTRHEFTAFTSGLWQPSSDLSLLDTIEAGTEIGTLTTFPDFEDVLIRATSSGTLIQYRRQQVVSTGTSLFGLGQPAEHLMIEAMETTVTCEFVTNNSTCTSLQNFALPFPNSLRSKYNLEVKPSLPDILCQTPDLS